MRACRPQSAARVESKTATTMSRKNRFDEGVVSEPKVGCEPETDPAPARTSSRSGQRSETNDGVSSRSVIRSLAGAVRAHTARARGSRDENR